MKLVVSDFVVLVQVVKENDFWDLHGLAEIALEKFLQLFAESFLFRYVFNNNSEIRQGSVPFVVVGVGLTNTVSDVEQREEVQDEEGASENYFIVSDIPLQSCHIDHPACASHLMV